MTVQYKILKVLDMLLSGDAESKQGSIDWRMIVSLKHQCNWRFKRANY